MDPRLQVQCKNTISAPVNKIWEILEDSTLLPKWMPNVNHTVIVTKQSDDVGEIRECKVSLTGRSGQLVEQRTEFIPLQRISYKVKRESFGFSKIIPELSYTMTLEHVGQNTTNVQLEYYYNENGLLGRIINTLMIKPQWRPLCSDMLSGLKKFAEETVEM